MNNIINKKKLSNHYYIMRHGQSKANVAKIILSNVDDGQLDDYALTKFGENQVKKSIQKTKEGLDNSTIIISSPFSRCRRTAEIAKEELHIKNKIIFDDRLRERWFGDFEKKHNSNYEKVWVDDKIDPKHTKSNVESALDVQKRTIELILELEKKYKEKNILLISHGDTLQIMQTGFAKKTPDVHRELPHLETGKIKKLKLG